MERERLICSFSQPGYFYIYMSIGWSRKCMSNPSTGTKSVSDLCVCMCVCVCVCVCVWSSLRDSVSRQKRETSLFHTTSETDKPSAVFTTWYAEWARLATYCTCSHLPVSLSHTVWQVQLTQVFLCQRLFWSSHVMAVERSWDSLCLFFCICFHCLDCQFLIPVLSDSRPPSTVVTRAVDQMKNNIHTELSQKMTATDSVIKEQISKIVRGRVSVSSLPYSTGWSNATGCLHRPFKPHDNMIGRQLENLKPV